MYLGVVTLHLSVTSATCLAKSALFRPSRGRLTRVSVLELNNLILPMKCLPKKPVLVSQVKLVLNLLLDVDTQCHGTDPLFVIVPL